ncbi:MAG: hypothetical protein ABSG43_25260 [Solirubrobacteraceae bacterium]
MTLTLTVTETLKGSRVVAIAAAVDRAGTSRRVLVLGKATASLAAGQAKTVHIELNGAGSRLLAQGHSLTAILTLTETAGGGSRTVSSQTITFTHKANTRHSGNR